MRKIIDLNCDMGEGFGHWVLSDAPDEELMALISSANIAAGFHAGDPNSMDRVIKLAQTYGVGLGAHPGYRDLQGIGRRYIKTTPEELVNDIIYQVGAVREFGRRHGIRLQHVKPHGALYMHVAKDEALAAALVEALQKVDPQLFLYCMGGSVLHRIARAAGQPVVREFYADRDYGPNGFIVFTRRVSALDPKAVAQKVLLACEQGVVKTIDGQTVAIEFDSVCIHSDTPGALSLVQETRQLLDARGVQVVGVNQLPLR